MDSRMKISVIVSVAVAAAVACCGRADVRLENESLSIGFADGTEGFGVREVVNRVAGTARFVRSSGDRADIWELAFSRWGDFASNEYVRVNNLAPAERRTFERDDGRLVLRWQGVDVGDERAVLDVTATVDLKGARSEWRLDVVNRGRKWTLHSTSYPCLRGIVPTGAATVMLPGSSTGGYLYERYGEGVQSRNLKRRYRYPGKAPMVSAWMLGDAGLYVAAEDGACRIKDMVVESADLTFETPVEAAGVFGRARGTPGYPVTIAAYRGDWWQAAKLYRQWALRQKWTAKGKIASRSDYPKRIAETELWLVTGGEAAVYEQKLKELRSCFPDLKLGLHWTTWSTVPFDTSDPEFFPTRKGVAEAMRRAADSGVTVMPYLNGRIWDTSLQGYRYAKVDAVKDELLSPRLEHWSGNHFATMCPSAPIWQDVVRDICRKTVAMGANVLYVDQITAASACTCFDAGHGHAVGGGSWWADGYRQMLTPVKADCAAKGVGLASEESGEWLMDVLDAGIWAQAPKEMDVPFVNAVYSGYTTYFGMHFSTRNSIEAFRSLAALNLIWGVTPGWNDGWVWTEKYTTTFPMYPILGAFAKVRRAGREFLAYGSLEDELRSLVPQEKVTVKWAEWRGDRTINCFTRDLPRIVGSVWLNAREDAVGVVAVNLSEKESSVRFKLPLGARTLSSVKVEGQPDPALTVKDGVCELRLAPFAAAVLKGTRGLWSADFSKGASAFDVEMSDGAVGDVSFSPDGLTIVKKSERGFICVRAKERVGAPSGSRVMAVAEEMSEDADPNYSVSCLRLVGEDGRLTQKAFKGLQTFNNGGPRSCQTVNTAPGRAMRKFALAQMRGKDLPKGDYDGNPFPETVQPAIVVAGPPSTTLWRNWRVDDFEAAGADWCAAAQAVAATCSVDQPQPALSDAELAERLRGDVDHTARVERRNGVSTLLVDGVPEAPVFYRERGKGEERFCSVRPMQEAGVRLSVISLSFGGEANFSVTDAVARVRRKMSFSPDSLFLLGLQVDPSPDFAAAHPDEVWRHADGSPVCYRGCHYAKGARPDPASGCYPWVSPLSEVWQAETERKIRDLVEALRQAGLAKRIVGAHISGFHDGQFSAVVPDYSAPAERAWRRYLRERYADAAPDWKMPPPEEYAPGKSPRTFLDPQAERRLVDFVRFRYRSVFDVQDRLGLAVKRAFGKDVVVVKWCMGGFTGHADSSYDFSRFLTCKGVDILVAQSTYGNRVPGIPLAENRVPDSFHLNGKLYVDEIDFRTWARVPAREELSAWGLGWAPDEWTWQSLHRRRTGQMMALRCGFWYYDISGGMFTPASIRKDIARSARVANELAARPVPDWRPSVAVVLDEDGVLLRNITGIRKAIDEILLVDGQLKLLESSGVPFRTYLVDDVIRTPHVLDDARLVVFLGLREINEERRRVLERLSSGARTIVHSQGDGWLGGMDATGFETDIDFDHHDHVLSPAPGFRPEEARSLLATERLRQSVNGRKGEWASWGFWRPVRWTVRQMPGVNPIAYYADDGKVAIAEKREGSVKKLYVAETAGVSPTLFNRLARESGAFVASRPGLQVSMSGNFLMIHCLVPGTYDIRLQNGSQMTVSLTAGETQWMIVETSGARRIE